VQHQHTKFLETETSTRLYFPEARTCTFERQALTGQQQTAALPRISGPSVQAVNNPPFPFFLSPRIMPADAQRGKNAASYSLRARPGI
jgi:hypothetical protein